MSIASSISGGGHPSSLPPSGAAGGDLSGTYPNPSVANDSHSHTQATLPSIPVVVYKSATENVNNSAVLQADDHLLSSSIDVGNYDFEFILHVTDATAAAAGGIKVALSGTATFANLIATVEILDINGPTLWHATRFTAAAQTSEITGAASMDVSIRGSVEVSVPGTLALQWAQSVATAGDLSILRGSTLTYQEAT